MIELNIKPTRRQLRHFGIAGAVILALLGAWVFFRHSIFTIALGPETAVTTATVLWSCAGTLLLFAAAVPAVLLPLYVVLAVAGWPIGFAVSILVMGVIYFLLITPLALFFRLIGRDPLHRTFLPDAETYWVDVGQRPGADRYFRQF